jgi:hypothetical protein
MRCSKCGVENAAETKFCPSCGSKFIPRAEPVSVEGETGAYYCFKHKKEITRVTCGRCEKPICPRCLIIGPAGVRCQDCARNRVAKRWKGVAHDAASGLGRIDGRKIWYAYLLAMIARMFGGWFR